VNVLGIETSCDETAAAFVTTTGDPAKPWRVLSNVIASQVEIHREWGGVVPEIASRQHVRDICGVTERALQDGGGSWGDIDALAVTQGPGLVGSLLVGISFAKALAASLDRPIVAVNHLVGHIESIVLEHRRDAAARRGAGRIGRTPSRVARTRACVSRFVGRTRG
jgi:N6-L-threonylcarbamoyladenine synthase